jgi:hypothetical protein
MLWSGDVSKVFNLTCDGLTLSVSQSFLSVSTSSFVTAGFIQHRSNPLPQRITYAVHRSLFQVSYVRRSSRTNILTAKVGIIRRQLFPPDQSPPKPNAHDTTTRSSTIVPQTTDQLEETRTESPKCLLTLPLKGWKPLLLPMLRVSFAVFVGLQVLTRARGEAVGIWEQRGTFS